MTLHGFTGKAWNRKTELENLRQAVAEERERCAKIAENYLIPEGTPEGIEIARLIRAGSGSGPEEVR